MAIITATVLYPANGTTVDTGTGIDIRVLSSSAGTLDTTQTCTATHTQDNVERTFDPATAGVTAINDSHTLQKLGWALRLTDDMTPTDDTNCNVVLPAGTVTVNMSMTLGWTGTPLQGSTPTGKASLWRYNPSTDTGTVIGTGSTAFVTWNAVGGNNTTKTVAISITVASSVEFSQGEVLLVQYGINTGTLGNPLSGTVTYTFTLQVDTSATNVTLDTGQALSQVCYFTGTSSGVATATATAVPVYPTSGTSSGTSTVSGLLEADKETTGTSSGVATATAVLGAVKETTGLSEGTATASGSPSLVKPTTGTVEIGAGGGTTTYIRPTIIFDD